MAKFSKACFAKKHSSTLLLPCRRVVKKAAPYVGGVQRL